MSSTTMLQGKFISMKIFQPILISGFTVMVLAASFLVGKHVGYSEGIQHSQIHQTMPATMEDTKDKS